MTRTGCLPKFWIDPPREGDHGYLVEPVAAAEQAGQVHYYDRDDAETGRYHPFRFVRDLPLNETNPDVRVNFLECWEWDGDQVHHFSWVTDLRVNKGRVYQIMRGGGLAGASRMRRSTR